MVTPSFASVTSNRYFRALWLNQVLLQLGLNMVNFSLLILVFKLTQSNTFVSLFILSIAVPAIVFGAFAGVIADIVDKKKLIIACDLGMATSAMALLLTRGELFFILLISLIINSFIQFFIPAETSAIPMVVTKKQLLVANSLFFFTFYGSLIAGYTLSGPFISFFGFSLIFLLVSILFILAALISFTLPALRVVAYSGGTGRKQRTSFIKDVRKDLKLTTRRIKQGWEFIVQHPVIWGAVGILVGVQAVVGALVTMAPGFLEKEIQISATESYMILAPLGAGLILGVAFMGKYGPLIRKYLLILRGTILCGVVLFLVGLLVAIGVLPLIFLSILSFLLGFFTVQVIIPAQTVLQEHSPPSVRGRIFSTLTIASSIAVALVTLLVGSLTDFLGILPILLTTGGMIALAGILGFWLKASIWQKFGFINHD